MTFRLRKITKTGVRSHPLQVDVVIDNEARWLGCKARDIEAFPAFRRLVAERCGFWLPTVDAARWDKLLAEAFERGQK